MAQAGGSEAAAIQVLKRAVELDQAKKFSEALTCYEQGIRLLLAVAKEIDDESKSSHYKKRAQDYLDRAEELKKAVTKAKTLGKTHKQIQIKAGATGYSYETIFGPLLDATLTTVVVEDAYIRAIHQIYNFLHLCELLVLKAPKMRKIILKTSYDPQNSKLQLERLEEIKRSLEKHNVELIFEFSDTLHDREIRLDSGWIVKIGRGLDYFRKADGTFSIGYGNYDLRECHETTIDIFHQQVVSS
ncbi:MIT domain-containing protein 1-like [Oratosquilla oratoria]|uniref:MIT domain-containing protein 1-like n=1 Tax=Oratosquilla oratoria TaxID=337810 RepID=UPI003F762673